MTNTKQLQAYLSPLGEPDQLERHTDERFQPKTVVNYRDDPERFAETRDHPIHHYNQTRQEWGDADTVATLLNRLDIDPVDVSITTIGGFTGEFSEALREVGCNVVFTDPMEEWVKEARGSGFEAVQCTAETLTTDLLQRSDAVATFECYFPFSPPSSAVYSTLRLLTTPHGLLFAESESTRESMREDGAERTFLSTLSPYIDIYGTERRYRETDSLRIYQFYQPAESRILLLESAAVLRTLHDYAERDDVEVRDNAVVVDASAVGWIAEELDIEPSRVDLAVGGLKELHHELSPDGLQKFLPPNIF